MQFVVTECLRCPTCHAGQQRTKWRDLKTSLTFKCTSVYLPLGVLSSDIECLALRFVAAGLLSAETPSRTSNLGLICSVTKFEAAIAAPFQCCALFFRASY